MLFGGLIIQVLIQAAILQISLKLIAKHEADTSFSKAAMVTAGITVGNFLVILLLGKIFPLLIWPAQIALTAAVIMTFCWISFWKSVIVVLVFVTFQVIFTVIMAVIFGISMASMFISAAKDGGMNLDYKHPAEARNEAVRQEAERMQREAMLMQQKAMQKQARIEAEARRIEMGEAPSTQPPAEGSYTPAPPPKEVPRKKYNTRRRTTTRRIDWEGAEASLRMGGVIAGADENMAMIDGRMVKAGDTVTTEYNGHQYRWTVKSVSRTSPSLEQLDVK